MKLEKRYIFETDNVLEGTYQKHDIGDWVREVIRQAIERRCSHNAIPEIVRQALMAHFDEDEVNFDHIEITFDRDYWKAAKAILLSYGNLYTYVFVQGYVVPYYKWIYDKEITINDHVYFLTEDDNFFRNKKVDNT